MLIIFIQWRMPRDLLWPHIDVDLAGQLGDAAQQFPRDLAHCPVRSQRDPYGPSVAVLGDRLVAVQIQGNNQRSRLVWSWQRRCLPSAGGQPQRGMLQLWLGRGQGDG